MQQKIDAAYNGPLTAAELAEYNAQRAQHWVIGSSGAMRHPMAAEACTDFGANPRRTWPMWLVVPLYCIGMVAFFLLGWAIFSMPSSETARILAILVGAPLAFIIAVAALARWLI